MGTEEEIPNPYLHNLDLQGSKEVSTEDLQQTFKIICAPPTHLPEGLCVKTFKLNRRLVASRVEHLWKKGVLVFIPKYNPSCDVMDGWVDNKLVWELKVTIEQVTRSTYLTIFNLHDDQRKVLASTPLHINKRTAIILPWTPDVDLDSIQINKFPVWVDLLMLHTMFIGGGSSQNSSMFGHSSLLWYCDSKKLILKHTWVRGDGPL